MVKGGHDFRASPTFYVARRDPSRCRGCGSCEELVACFSGRVGYAEGCIGCGACSLACPYQAIEMREREKVKEIEIRIDGEKFSVEERMTVLKALELAGYKVSRYPGKGFFAPCGVGGCWSCAVVVDGEVKPSCITGVKDGW